MASEQELTLGAVVDLSTDGKGNYTATQPGLNLGYPPTDVGARIGINWSFGPVKIEGYVDPSTFELAVNVSVVGISIGNIYGNLKDGVGIKVDLIVAKGSIKFFLKNGNEVWVAVDLSITFDGSFKKEAKLVTI